MLLCVVVLVLLCLLEWLLFAVLVCVVCLLVDCALGFTNCCVIVVLHGLLVVWFWLVGFGCF